MPCHVATETQPRRAWQLRINPIITENPTTQNQIIRLYDPKSSKLINGEMREGEEEMEEWQ